MSSPSSATFRYEAARADGVRVRGVIEAASRPAAAAVLSARGLFPLWVESKSADPRAWFGRPSVREQATLMQGLASLVDSGVPLDQALGVARTVATGSLREGTARVAERVRQGSSLAASLEAEKLLSPVTVGLVRAGERGLGLGVGLAHAAAQLERQADTTARIRSALAYPALLAIVGIASVGLIVLVVVPKFAALLNDLGQSLPTATRVLLAGSALVRDFSLVLVVLAVGGAATLARDVERRRAVWHRWLLGLPAIGPIRHALATARAGRTLAALLGTGTPALDAIRLTALAVGDAAVAERLAQAGDRVAEGAPVSAALAATGALTAAAVQLARLGEGTGRVPALLAKAADLEDQAAERRLGVLVGLLEPALIIAFAGLVAFVAAALLQAVYAVRPG